MKVRVDERDVIVTVTSNSSDGLEARFQKLERAFAYSCKPRVQNAAAQVLDAALKGFKKSESKRFQQLGTEDAGLNAASTAFGVSAETFARKADALITRRNASVHPSTLEELNDEVEEVSHMITPAVKQLLNWECRVIEMYDAIKTAFPMYLQKVNN